MIISAVTGALDATIRSPRASDTEVDVKSSPRRLPGAIAQPVIPAPTLATVTLTKATPGGRMIESDTFVDEKRMYADSDSVRASPIVTFGKTVVASDVCTAEIFKPYEEIKVDWVKLNGPAVELAVL